MQLLLLKISIWMHLKQKHLLICLKVLKLDEKKTLFVIPEYNDNLYLSLRNIPNVAGSLLSDMNTYDIVNADVLVLTESAAKIFAEEEEEVEA